MSCGCLSILISQPFLVKLFTKRCFVLKHQLLVDIRLCPHHWSVKVLKVVRTKNFLDAPGYLGVQRSTAQVNCLTLDTNILTELG